METADRLAQLFDPSLPASALMFGPDSTAMLATAEGLLLSEPISAEPRQILWHPGRQLIIRYSVRTAADPNGPATDVVAATGDAIPKRLRDGHPAQALAWRIPDDPWLPGLASALSVPTVSAMLEGLGAAPASIQLRLRAYRPTRRAVVQVIHPGATLFLKVVPVRSVARLDAMHRAFDSAVRTPRSMGWSQQLGIAVLEGLPGRTLREALADPRAELPPPGVLGGILDALPLIPDANVVGGPTASVARHVALLEQVVPESRPALAALLEACSLAPAGEPSDPVHGDFYESQILVERGSITGLIDIDRMGRGRRVDDWATLAGHLAAYAMSAPDPGRVRAYGTKVIGIADKVVDPTELRRVTAAALIAMATGPFRVQSPDWPAATARRIAAAADWLESSGSPAGRERSLMDTSQPTHGAARL